MQNVRRVNSECSVHRFISSYGDVLREVEGKEDPVIFICVDSALPRGAVHGCARFQTDCLPLNQIELK